jgi:hypothetical protein
MVTVPVPGPVAYRLELQPRRESLQGNGKRTLPAATYLDTNARESIATATVPGPVVLQLERWSASAAA